MGNETPSIQEGLTISPELRNLVYIIRGQQVMLEVDSSKLKHLFEVAICNLKQVIADSKITTYCTIK